MNVYDFDGTIYDGDSTIDFYLFCLKTNKKIIILLPKQIFSFILYKMKLKNKIYFKQTFFSFLKYMNNIDVIIENFWDKNICKITKWYKNQQKNDDVIISASPLFLLKPLEKKLSINKVIATEVNKKNGLFLGKNCYGKEKVNFFKKYYSLKNINEFYSDSLSDIYMLQLAKSGYIVKNKKNIIEKYNRK